MGKIGDLFFRLGLLPTSEMAESRKDAEKTIRGLGYQIILHLVKILYWKDSKNFDKHCNDISLWLRKCQDITLKPNSKSIPAKDYYFWIFEASFSGANDEYIERQWKSIFSHLSSYSHLTKLGLTKEQLHSKIKEIMKKVSVDLENAEFKSIKDYL